MNEHSHQDVSLYVGLDVHKDSIDIAIVAAGHDGEVRHIGTVAGGLQPVTMALRRRVSPASVCTSVYEAGPCGFVRQRHLAALGYRCDVVAPSSIPKRSGDRVKTDRRDALMLARQVRAGELAAVRVPGAADEALRDLVHAREDSRCASSATHVFASRRCSCATASSTPAAPPGPPRTSAGWPRSRCRIRCSRSPSRNICTPWLTPPLAPLALELSLRDALPGWSLAPAVAALQALRGVRLIAAITLVAEIQEFHRFTSFTNPRQLMSYLGLVPSEDSSGSRRRQHHHQGRQQRSPSPAGRGRPPLSPPRAHQRRHRTPPGRSASRRHRHRLEGRSCVCVRASSAWPHAACPHNKSVVAVARELAGFVWAIAREVTPAPAAMRRD
jgi:hypothetical protein